MGLTVICADSGKKIGVVKDIIFCIKNMEVKAFVLEHKGVELRKKVILLKDVLNLGKDAVVVNDSNCITSFSKALKTEDMKYHGKIKGLKVYTRDGSDLGTVNDVLLDFKNGSIEGVEVSDGIFQDIILGRKVVPLFGKVEVGSENILIDKEAQEEITTTGGGLKKIITGTESAADPIEEAKND